MYVTTFYSFKGGVGRTMALVNAAVTLALRGRRVLAVDFDVEAPGLDTFDVLRPREEIPGIIDFVARYLASGQAPDATDFIGECPDIGEQGGRLWIMPSGRKETYAANFNQLDWGELYEKHGGYLLLEDLKEQWKQIIRPDYVLIDSRTGYTDTGGICTRQLPDSVVLFFFPNEQNLRGLTEVVRDIRSEADEPRKKRIELHFVMSNVPDLDDEDLILESKISAFQDQLDFPREPMIVHRYDSLSLLDQVVFVKDRPRSRLANEYNSIVQEISVRNWNDRDGALEYIRRAASRRWRRIEKDSIWRRENMLDSIEEIHSNDGEVLFRLAEIRETDRQPERTVLLVNQAIDAGYEQPEAYLKRARIREDNQDTDGASEDTRRVLGSKRVAPPMIREAIRLSARLGTYVLEEIVESTAVMSLEPDGKVWLANIFNRSREDLMIAVSLWEQVLGADELSSETRGRAKRSLGLSYMGLGRCSDAIRMFRDDGQALDELNIENTFNYGMARWGVNGTIETEMFRRVVELDRSGIQKEQTSKHPQFYMANYLQCMAIAYWATGDGGEALVHIDRAQETVGGLRGRTVFSCWHYLQVSAELFEADLVDIRDLIENDGSQMPSFVDRASTTKKQAMEALDQTLQARREDGKRITLNTENHRRRAWEVFVSWAAGHGIDPLACSDETLVRYVREAHGGTIPRQWSKHLFSIMNAIYEHRGTKLNPSRRGSPARLEARNLFGA